MVRFDVELFDDSGRRPADGEQVIAGNRVFQDAEAVLLEVISIMHVAKHSPGRG